MKILIIILLISMIFVSNEGFGQIAGFGTNSRMSQNTMRKAPYIIYNGE